MVKRVVRTETVTTESVQEAHSVETKNPVIITKKVEETTEKKIPAKKSSPKVKTIKKKRVKKVSDPNKPKRMTAIEREEMLIQNFVGLQHAMTNLSIKFGSLSDNISNLLMVFEEAARNFAEGGTGLRDNQDMIKKINSLLEQNKTIARGLVLMEGKLRGKTNEPVNTSSNQPTQNSQFSNMNPSVSDMPPRSSRQLPSI